MKRTFQQNDCVHAPHPALQKALIDYAVSKGVPVYRVTNANAGDESYPMSWPNIIFNFHRIMDNLSIEGHPDNNWITVKEFYEYCDNWKECHRVTVQMNDKYAAKINAQDKTVEVGCQTFTFDKVLELADKIKQTTNQ